MSDSVPLQLPRLRCAPFHEAQGADPIGSTGSYDGFLVIDVALPWEREVTSQEPWRSIVDGPTSAAVAPDGSRWRPFARVPAPAAGPDDVGRRITGHRASTERVRLSDGSEVELRGPYVGREWTVPADDVVGVARSLQLTGATPTAAPHGAGSAPAGRVVAICTHGRRDQCCGGPGTALFDELSRAGVGGVAFERISHTGGHRFAPTALTFPDGYAWAHLDAGLVEGIVQRSSPAAQVAAHCRGSALFDGAPAQAADRAGLVAVGWDWADSGRAVQLRAFDRTTLATTVRVVGRLGDGSTRAFDVTSSPDRHIPTPTCGLVDGPEYTTETVWRVDRVEEVDVSIDGSAAPQRPSRRAGR